MYVTFGDLFTFVLMLVAILTYIDNRNSRHKK